MTATPDHKSRGHALLSASGAHRWTHCTPSARLEADMPSTDSAAAQEGTLAHEMCELKVRNYFYPQELSKRSLNAKLKKLRESELYDPEMDGYTDDYLQYIKEQAIKRGKDGLHVVIEKRVDFSDIVPDGFGTADCILITGETLHVIDFKYGKGVAVSAEDNPQLILYAIGAFNAYGFIYPIRAVELHIVQPRISNTNSFVMTVAHLSDSELWLRERAELAYKGEGYFAPSESSCRFCRARSRCRARAEHNVQMAFGSIGKLPPLITNEELAAYIEQGEDVAKWLSDLKEYALSACLRGEDIPGYKAVEGRGRRAWTDEAEAFKAIVASGMDENMLYERVALSLAKCEKLIGKKDFGAICGDYVVNNPGPPTLVKASDKRPAVTLKTSAAEAFANINE